MIKFKSPLEKLAEFKEVSRKIKDGDTPILISGVGDAAKPYLTYELGAKSRSKLIVTYSEIRANEIAEDLASFDENVLVYPAKDLLFYEADTSGNYLIKKRMDVIKSIVSGEAVMVVTAVDTLLERLAPINEVEKGVIKIETGKEINLEKFIEKLTRIGYERLPEIESPGEFAVRGGIIDIYPLASDDPYRIELYGEEIDTIRSFEIETQRSAQNLDAITIFPAKEIDFDEFSSFDDEDEQEDELMISFIDYFPEGSAIFLDEPENIKNKALAIYDEYSESISKRKKAKIEGAEKAPKLFEINEIWERLNEKTTAALTTLDGRGAGLKYAYSCQLVNQSVSTYREQYTELIDDLKRWNESRARVVFFAGSSSKALRIASEFSQNGIITFMDVDESGEIPEGGVLVTSGDIKKGFSYPIIKFYAISYGDVFSREKRKKKKRRANPNGLNVSELSSLKVGDYVVHENYGIGIYEGIRKENILGVSKDYMKIAYRDNGSLFVPITHIDVVQKYADRDIEKKPRLNSISGDDWSRIKARAKKEIDAIAEELVSLYAERMKGTGFKFSPDTAWQEEFEEQFKYEETDDQLRAIEETKADMESTKIMDRLICGDVGFGKTEIAIRAAFKAVQDGKQVAYLVPTTILASQHYNTFVQRLAEYGPNIELLCRFKTKKEQAETVKRLKQGKVDIVIGTHRLLSKDVEFCNLGLLVIDEEQRFGVSDKEKIKQLKKDVDVLSLTATPIPRTLHMSLIGARDMSMLREAPLDRSPIQTYVMENNIEIVREAIARELARDGQVYYVVNHIQGIATLTAQIQSLFPDANVAFAHGKMKPRELEDIMMDFVNGDIDVLVSTTIIETGLDISNVNTIIIHNADKYGLSQLYQLRGRVGRSSRTAFAFLLYNNGLALTENGEKRLEAIRENTDLGSGVKLAMRDLEIRGAGNILGMAQHGHLSKIGYDMYCKMLGSAVKELKGEKKIKEDFETKVNISIDAYLPETYVESSASRMNLYRRIAYIETDDDIMDMIDELIDRYGQVPEPAQNLVHIGHIKNLAHNSYVTDLSVKLMEDGHKEIDFKMYNNAPVNLEKLGEIIARYNGDLQIRAADGKTTLTFIDKKKASSSTMGLFDQIKKILADIGYIMV